MHYYETPGHNISAAVVLSVADIIAVSLRFWVRRKQSQPLKADDWLMIPALFLTVGIAIAILYGVSQEAIGYPLRLPKDYTGSPYQIHTRQLELSGQVEWSFNLMFPLALGCTKASLLFFYLRVFSVEKWNKRTVFIKVLITLITLWAVAFFFAVLFACGTHFDAIWGPTQNLYTICTNTLHRLVSLCFTDFFADIIIILIPVPIIWRLNLTRGRKIGILAVFLLAVVSIAASLTRLIIVSNTVFLGFTPSNDEILGVTVVIYWGMIELGIGIIVACLPSLTFLLRDISWERATTTARSLLRTRHWGSSYTQHDKHPTTPSRMYDVESGKARSESIRASFSHHVRRHVSHDPMPAGSANIAPPPHVRLTRSYDTDIAESRQVPRDFVAASG
ncbi:hypothetical protein F4679DRAFT_8456 [Xylaria curta]|nr:hypothetical protein F4679DRAFT_8456 [Xylaria curta]